jgi:hypothetical protein
MEEFGAVPFPLLPFNPGSYGNIGVAFLNMCLSLALGLNESILAITRGQTGTSVLNIES